MQHEATATNVSSNQNTLLPQVVAIANGRTSSNQAANKKFTTTNRVRNANSFSKANGNITAAVSNGGSVQAKHHLHHQHPQVCSKLKPVKERRPTALPTEQPKIENDEDSGQQKNARDVLDGAAQDLRGGTNGKPATFFIGGGYPVSGDESSDSDNDDVVLAAVPAVNENDYASRGVSSVSLKQQHLENVSLLRINSKQTLTSSATSTPLPSPSITSSLAPSPLAARSATTDAAAGYGATSSKLRTKFPSNSSNKLRKFGRTDTATSTLSQHVEIEKVHIPTPPPLPPQPLCVVTSPSLQSLVSKSKRSSNLSESQPLPGEAATVTLTETEVKTQASPTLTSATHDGGNTKARVS